MAPGTRLTSAYFTIQALLGAVWWVGVWAIPVVREAFSPRGYPPDFIGTYALPDVLLVVLGSASVAVVYALPAFARAAVPLQFLVTGAVAYAALHCVGIAIETPGSWPPAVLMGLAMAGTITLACTSHPGHGPMPVIPFAVFRRGPVPALFWTFAQMVAFWGVFLLLAPSVLIAVERGLGVERFTALATPGWGVFGLCSALGVWSAWVMASRGLGTPLPTAAAPRLVTSGPYAWVRNPMAVAGVGQGLGVAMAMGSVAVGVYILIGALLWHLCVRPAEERDLERRFGEAFAAYRSRVGCWLPWLGRGV